MNYYEKEAMANNIAQQIEDFDTTTQLLVNNITALEKQVLARQIVDSINRVRYFQMIENRDISADRADPNSHLFDPIKAVIFYKRNGNLEEAFWLSFLIVHFGENYQSGWNLTKNFYNNMGCQPQLTWDNVTQNPNLVEEWVNTYEQNPTIKLKFGNHRKYESISQLMAVIESYIAFVRSNNGQLPAYAAHADNAKQRFANLYDDFDVYRFGRLGKFDFLSILYKFGLAEIEANCCYLKEATGPKAGAKYLFGNLPTSQLDTNAQSLADYLGIGYQEMEDALCNWHKSTDRYEAYVG